jgi:hypothetical protein
MPESPLDSSTFTAYVEHAYRKGVCVMTKVTIRQCPV